MVSMRFLVSWPVSSIGPPPLALQRSTPRGPKFFRKLGKSFSGDSPAAPAPRIGVQVVEEAEELVEAVVGRQEFVLVAEVVLAELAGGVAQRLQQLGDGGILGLQAEVGSRHADLAQAGAETLWPVMKAERPAVQLCSP